VSKKGKRSTVPMYHVQINGNNNKRNTTGFTAKFTSAVFSRGTIGVDLLLRLVPEVAAESL